MATQSGVFVLQNDESLVAMQPTAFGAEIDFQKLLSRFPALLAGDQIDPDNPRRFVLVKQEQAVGHDSDPTRWSLDHLFLDQDGIPTLVEVKRQSDSRLRREVIGQILEYASNCQTFWTVQQMQASFEVTCTNAGTSSDSVLNELLGNERTAEAFWEDAKANLRAGNLRMLIVADKVPTELRRIVEFLNEQMVSAEILAIELKQFSSGALRTIVPTVFGQTQAAVQQRATVAPRSIWTEERLLARFASNLKPSANAAAQEIYGWMKQSGIPLRFGTGTVEGSVMFYFRAGGAIINPAYLSTYGQLWVYLSVLATKPGFRDEEARRELVRQFGTVNGASLSEEKLNQDQSISFDIIAADSLGVEKIVSAMKWVIGQIGTLE